MMKVIFMVLSLLLFSLSICFAQAEENVALLTLGATATDNGYFDDYGVARDASKAIDGDESTYWAGRQNASPQTMTINFDKYFSINRIRILELYNNGVSYFTNADFEYYDGSNWQLLFNETKSQPNMDRSFESIEVSKVRIKVNSVVTPSTWYNKVACIYSFEVYGIEEGPLPPTEEDLVVYYPFDGNADDESGNGYDGTVYGPIPVPDRFGNPNNAFYFDGSNDWIEAGLNVKEPTGSISLWFYAEELENSMLFCQIHHPYTPATLNYHLSGSGDDEGFLDIRSDLGIQAGIQTKNVTSLNEWHHLVCIWGEFGSKLYLDGELQGSTNLTYYDNSSTINMGIGCYNGHHGIAHYFHGSIDDFRIYNYALSDLEITDLYVPGNEMPIADAGQPQTKHPGEMVTLDGSGSADPDAHYPLSYAWQFISKPQNSQAVLMNYDQVSPSFEVDALGDYVIELIVTDANGMGSQPAQVQISTTNSPPIADAGSDQAVIVVGSDIQLDGTQSWDDDGDDISYNWEIIQKPNGSNATLNNPTLAMPTFTADVNGEYVIELVVNDPWISSPADEAIISFNNIRPVAIAKENQSCLVGETVSFDGSKSYDDNNDGLSYHWQIASAPEGSAAELSAQTSVITSLAPDQVGEYVILLVVNDGLLDSEPSSVSLSVLSRRTEVVEAVEEVITAINDLPPDVFNNKNNGKALTNKLNDVLLLLDAEDYAAALEKLENDVLKKTDGCANTGTPDKNDWIEDCVSQGEIYPILIDAITLISEILNGLPKTAVNQIPGTFQLNQNYPNPFNPQTRIGFQLSEAAHVKLTIYNAVGEDIRPLVNSSYEAGYHSVLWDGKDINGFQVSSGIYIYRIQAGTFQDVKKMILIK